MTSKKFLDLVQVIFPRDTKPTDRTKEIVAVRDPALISLFDFAPTNEAIRGTAWAGYQAITEYLDHHSAVRTAGITRRPALCGPLAGPLRR